LKLKEIWKYGKFFFGHDFKKYESDLLAIFEKIFGLNRLELVIHGKEKAEDYKKELFLKTINLRKSGYPLQYILESEYFCGIKLKVGEGVFIPRKDTEILVKTCVNILKKEFNLPKLKPKIIDLCSGSGAIAILIKKNFNNSEITAIEKSPQAFKFLCKNIKRNNLEINTILADIFKFYDNFPDLNFDMIISNPPYIASNDMWSLSKEINFEPKMALHGGIEGLDFYYKIIDKWANKLKINGVMAFEVGFNQAEKVAKMFEKSKFDFVKTKKDLSGVDRVVLARRKF
jgi:release factor glutamine methyltransferase